MENHTWRRHAVNKDFFKTHTNNMAWVLGLVASDGCIDNVYKSWMLTMKDKDCLEQVAEIVGYSGGVHTKSNTTDCYNLHVHCKEMVKDLMPLGITLRKSLTLEYPDISSNLDASFIRGYFDGDGWFYEQETQHSTGLHKGQVGITTGSKLFAETISSKLLINGMNPTIKERSRGFVSFPNGITSYRNITYIVRITGYSVAMFYNFIYDNTTEEVRLKRKYDKYTTWYNKFGVAYQGKKLNPTPSRAIRFMEVHYG